MVQVVVCRAFTSKPGFSLEKRTSPVATSVTVTPTEIPTLVDEVNAAALPFGKTQSRTMGG